MAEGEPLVLENPSSRLWLMTSSMGLPSGSRLARALARALARNMTRTMTTVVTLMIQYGVRGTLTVTCHLSGWMAGKDQGPFVAIAGPSAPKSYLKPLRPHCHVGETLRPCRIRQKHPGLS